MYRRNFPFLVGILVSLCSYNSADHVMKNNLSCLQVEREALVAFKQGVIDPAGRLSSWKGKDCCRWHGVKCSNNSDSSGLNHVIGLDLDSFPENVTSRYLAGEISPYLGNLSSLEYLDLSYNYQLKVTDLRWLRSLTSLVALSLDQIELDKTREGLFESLPKLSSLEELYLSGCRLFKLPYSLPHINFTSLAILDLSSNNFDSFLPPWFFNLTSLMVLDLDDNPFGRVSTDWDFSSFRVLHFLFLGSIGMGGQLPKSLGNLCKFTHLNLSGNKLRGTMKEFFSGLSNCSNGNNLTYLDLSDNQLEGEIPTSIEILKHLQDSFPENVTSRYFAGEIPPHLGNLSSLEYLDLSHNYELKRMDLRWLGSLTSLVHLSLNQIELDKTREGLFESLHKLPSLKRLYLSSCRLFKLPYSLPNVNFTSLAILDLSSNNFDSFLPPWFFNLTSLMVLDLDDNPFGRVSTDWDFSSFRVLHFLNLASIGMGGQLLKSLGSLCKFKYLNLSGNKLSGTMDEFFHGFSNCSNGNNLTYLDLSDNQLEGEIPASIEILKHLRELSLRDNYITGGISSWIYTLEYLQLNNNQFSGSLPECSNKSSFALRILDVSYNNISGMLPSSLFFSTTLEILSLSNNRLQGRIPASLQKFSLACFDVGGNMLSGTLPTWAPASWVLRLKSNYFHGPIPDQWCDNPKLHILDLADNNLSGPIPQCISHLKAMFSDSFIPEEEEIYVAINEITKGRELIYSSKTSRLLKLIDLSRNNLSDEIPLGLMNLSGLGFLNLSMNHFIGRIPENVGNLGLLETLDLSNNNLSGEIPQSILFMTMLNHLNLSYNKLEGRIPSGSQLQTFSDLSIYEGNSLLCGLPLPNKCNMDEGDSADDQTKDGDDNLVWFFISMATGYVFGLGGVCVVLWVNVSLRKSLFGFFRL